MKKKGELGLPSGLGFLSICLLINLNFLYPKIIDVNPIKRALLKIRKKKYFISSLRDDKT